MHDFIHLEEHYEDGRCVKRTLNGIEVAADEFASAVQFAPHVVLRKQMTLRVAQELYPEHFGPPL